MTSTPPLSKKLGKYEFSLSQKLGSGLTGDAYVGINTETSEMVCVKVIDHLSFTTESQHRMLSNEIKCQQLLQHQNCLRIYDVFDTNDFTFIVTELCENGDLFKLIQHSAQSIAMSEIPLSPSPGHTATKPIPRLLIEMEIYKKYAFDIAKALLHMKQQRIIHRDIKCENILIAHDKKKPQPLQPQLTHHDNIAKLGDFGFAITEQYSLHLTLFYRNLKEAKQPFNLGSPLYMSLEVLEENKYSYKSDVFSYGVVLYEMLYRVSPWECQTEAELKTKLKSEEVRFFGDEQSLEGQEDKEGGDVVGQKLRDLIKNCLALKVEDRISIEEIVEHPFFEDLKKETNQKQKQGMLSGQTESDKVLKVEEIEPQEGRSSSLNESPENSKKSESQETSEKESQKSPSQGQKDVQTSESLPSVTV